MSSTVLWVVDSNYYGHEYAEINNSILFATYVDIIFSEKYLSSYAVTDSDWGRHINQAIEDTDDMKYKVVWEMYNGSMFRTSDRHKVIRYLKEYMDDIQHKDEIKVWKHISCIKNIIKAIYSIDAFPTSRYFCLQASTVSPIVPRYFKEYNSKYDTVVPRKLYMIDEYIFDFALFSDDGNRLSNVPNNKFEYF